jgi:hypothetical protein
LKSTEAAFVPGIDLPWRPDERDRKMAVRVHCDNQKCSNSINEQNVKPGWFTLEETDPFMSYSKIIFAWNFCSLECIEAWTESEKAKRDA